MLFNGGDLWLLRNGEPVWKKNYTGFSKTSSRALYVDKDNMIWAGFSQTPFSTFNGILRIDKHGNTLDTLLDGIDINDTDVNDAADTLWVGTANGLYSIYMETKSTKLYLSNQPISRVAYMGYGRIGVTNGTNGANGASVFNYKTGSHLNISSKLTSKRVRGLFGENDHTLLLATKEGINKLTWSTLIDGVSFQNSLIETMIIDSAKSEVNITVASGTDVTSLTAEISIAEEAKISKALDQNPTNFSNPQTIEVSTNDNLIKRSWTIIVTEQDPNTMGGSVSESTDVLLYPNPSAHVINLTTNSDCEVVIFDNSGKAMITQASVNGLINISSFASGIYYVQIPCKGNRIQKFIKI